MEGKGEIPFSMSKTAFKTIQHDTLKCKNWPLQCQSFFGRGWVVQSDEATLPLYGV